MAKLLLLSILISIIALPAIAAREKSAARGLKKTLVYYLAFNVFYVFAIRYLYVRLL